MKELSSFENKSLIEFLKSEFKTRKRRDGVFGTISSLFQLPVFGTVNYLIQKSWNETYKSIESILLNFYPELNCKFTGKRPTFIDLLVNYGSERIEFKFDKAHVAVTKDSFYVFPYDSSELKNQGVHYNMLEVPFRIIYNPKEKTDKYSMIRTVPKFVSIKKENGKTTIKFKSKDLSLENELIFDNEIIVANADDSGANQ